MKWEGKLKGGTTFDVGGGSEKSIVTGGVSVGGRKSRVKWG